MADVGIAEIPRAGGGPGARQGLAILSQPDFRSGMWRGYARNLMPADAVYDLVNWLFSDEWSLFKRGGDAYKSNAAFGARLSFVWDGLLAGGQRTLIANPADFGVLDVDDATPINVGGAGLAAPVQAVGLAGVLFIGNGAIYAGSRKAAGYSAGTVGIDFTTGIVTGTGTAWSANVDPGGLLFFADRYFPIKSVDSNTQLTLAMAAPAPATTLVGQVTLPATPLTVKSTSAFPSQGTLRVGDQTVTYTGKTPTTFTGCTGGAGVIADGSPVTALTAAPPLSYTITQLGSSALAGAQYRTSEFYAVAGRRLLSLEGDTIRFSNRDNPHVFDANDFHKLPAGPNGIGMMGIGDSALIFTTQGLYTLTGLINPIVDATGNPLHRLQAFSSDFVLWGNAGLAQFSGQVVAPCVDDIWLLDGHSAPERLSASISKLYRDYVAAGYKPGGATVFRSHYILPILDTNNAWVDTLVCRLDRPAWRGRHIPLTWPWSRLDGHAAKQAAFAQRIDATTRVPDLFGAGLDARVASMKGCFAPAAANKLDADGTVPVVRLVTRDYEPMGGNLCHVVKLRSRYELVDASATADLISNPGFEVNTSGWSTSASSALVAGATLARVAGGYRGGFSGQVDTTLDSQGIVFPISCVVGKTYTFSVRLKGNAGGEDVAIFLRAADGSTFANQGFTLSTGWQEVTVQWPANVGPAEAIVRSAGPGAKRFFVDEAHVPAALDNPRILGFLSDGSVQSSVATYGSAIYGQSVYASSLFGEFVPLSGAAPPDDGRHPYPWPFARRTRFVRFMLELDDPAASLVLRQLDVYYRPPGRAR